MSQSPDRKRMKGVGRVTFIAHLAEISAELDAGWPIKAIYEKRKGQLGMSYAQFARYIDQIVRRGRSTQAQTRPSPAPSQPAPAIRPLLELPAPTIASEGTNHAGYRPPSAGHSIGVADGTFAGSARTFNHDPLEGPDDRKRLLGEE